VDQEEMTLHQKVNVLVFFIYAQKWKFWKEKKTKFDHALVFSCLHLLLSKEKSIILLYQHYYAMGPWIFSTKAHLLLFPPQNHNVGCTICLLGASNSVVILIIFPWCKPK
jgi:hypothetical protein